ncbi:MAG: sigma-70 family RNA polymerase sigma factor [Actinomycetota bacterium]|nr:sigma-70 family RNA polymerase sigma factor [Actinomycetota bacterium]
MLTSNQLRERHNVEHDVDLHRGQLLAAIAGGDTDAFGELYDIFERPVYSVALRTTNDRQRAEEVVQDTFLKIWRNAARFDPHKGIAGAWIFTIAKRAAIDASRRERRTPVPSEFSPEEASVPDATDELGASWEVNLALSTLPEDQRRVIDLFVIAGFTHAEVADRLEIPLGTVKTRIYSGLKRLRRSLEERSAGVER